jgi:hypothetical protein
MRISADDIDRRLNEMNDNTDDNGDFLEARNPSNIRRYGRMVAIGFGVLVLTGASYLVYRRVKRRSTAQRLRTTLLDSLRELPHEASSRLKESIPAVKVVVSERAAEGVGTLEAMARRVVPAAVGTATTAVLEHFSRTPASKRSDAKAD